MRLYDTGSRLLLFSILAFTLVAPTTFAQNNETPDLTKACAKECPNATSNEDALKCVENLEKASGEAAFKKAHKTCYDAHEKYEKMTGREESGEAAER